jgi:hypothetical protein
MQIPLIGIAEWRITARLTSNGRIIQDHPSFEFDGKAISLGSVDLGDCRDPG